MRVRLLRIAAISLIAFILLVLAAACREDPQFHLVVEKDGDGDGTVTSADLAIGCGDVCGLIGYYQSGEVLTLTAREDSDSTFVGWSGDCTPLPEETKCEVDFTRGVGVLPRLVVTATFDLKSAAPVAPATQTIVHPTVQAVAPPVVLTDETPLILTVNSAGDDPDVNPGDAICETGPGTGVCTLRAAIEEANANLGLDTIAFDIPGAGPHTIEPVPRLPDISDPVVIDGTTEPDFAGIPVIELNGASAGADTTGLVIRGGGTTVRGLAINRFTGFGIRLQGSGGNLIEGNFIGTDVTGTLDLGNGQHGLRLSSSDNIIGGTTPEARNLISGNDQHGINITVGARNVIQGNFIGTDLTGTVDLGNSDNGVHIINASDNTIGGTAPGAGNVISGNNRSGIEIEYTSRRNLIQGNLIGTDVTGTVALGNSGAGVRFKNVQDSIIGGTTFGSRNIISGNDFNGIDIMLRESSGNHVEGNFIGTDITGTLAIGNTQNGVSIFQAPNSTIGGADTGAGNLISGNGGVGVSITGTDINDAAGTAVLGNLVGTDVTGTLDLGNGGDGVSISRSPDNIIGGTTPEARNVISGNGGSGVSITREQASGNRVEGNFIGTDITGSANLGNEGGGVAISENARDNVIGGIASGAGKTIFFNGGDGVSVFTFSGDIAGNSILSNSISSNAGRGIDLSRDGVSLNDAGDGDTGANNLQNFPVLDTATAGSVTIEGSLNSAASTEFRIEFFTNSSCDASGHGEGETFLGFTTVTTDGAGDASFVAPFPADVPAGQFVTATATDPDNNTSEFSLCREVLL